MIASSITSAGNPTFPTNAQSGATITLDATSDPDIVTGKQIGRAHV